MIKNNKDNMMQSLHLHVIFSLIIYTHQLHKKKKKTRGNNASGLFGELNSSFHFILLFLFSCMLKKLYTIIVYII